MAGRNDKATEAIKRTSVPEEHPALDLMNTVFRVGDELVDTLQTDEDVVAWLKRADWPLRSRLQDEPTALLRSARELRETIRAMVQGRKAGKRVDPHELNHFLADARSQLQLIPSRSGITLHREWLQQTPHQVLAPIAEAAATLIAEDDFDLIRPCEDSDCVLWFYDRTKSHRRRWCSTATCGNRNKVRAFRERQSSTAPATPAKSR